jgi:hypothetical protein
MNSSSEITPNNGGQQANHTGNALERFVEHALTEHGYTEFINHKDQVFAMRNTIGGKQYSKQPYCGQSIYDTKRNCDFLIMNLEKFPEGLIVECKWQQSSGSVDEKYPFTVHNIMKIGVPTVILIDGGGYKKQALTWLKEQAGKERALVGVYTMSEFQAVVNKGFLG